MAITFAKDDYVPYSPEGPYAKERVTVTTTGGTTSGSYTTSLSVVKGVEGNVSWSVSGTTVSVANLPANAVYTIETYGYI